MKKSLQVLFGFALVATLALPTICAADAAADYKAKCAGCHGASGVPSEGMAKSMGLKPLGGADVQAMSDADLASAIANGKGKMKGMKGTFSDAQISDLVKYIRTLKK
jgi:mono/diheme cytochrome c family protein